MNPLHLILLLLVVFFWGLNFVFVKIALQEIPPILLCFFRFFLVSIPAICFFKRPAVPFKWIILYSLVMFVLQFALMFTGIRMGVSAGLGSLLLQTQVFFSLFFASVFFKEKLNLWQILGALLSFSGIAIVGFNLGADVSLPGLLLVITAAATWGGGSIIVKKMGKVQSGSLLVWSSLLAWPPLLLLSFLIEGRLPTLLDFHQFSTESYAAILFIALFSTAFGFGTWNWLVQLYPLSTVAPFTLLVPVFAILASTLYLHEPLESWKILAALLVIGGLCVNIIGSRLVSARPIADE